MPGQFSLQDVVGDGDHRLVLAGELDLTAVPVLERCLREICTHETSSVTIDLSGLTFMDSNGLRIVLLARELCEQNGCDFMLVQGPAQVRRLFDLSCLLDRLPFREQSSQAEHYQGS
ncbi:MAG: STAS domain-containing protein [Solirubrobacteraceae bacterium]